MTRTITIAAAIVVLIYLWPAFWFLANFAFRALEQIGL